MKGSRAGVTTVALLTLLVVPREPRGLESQEWGEASQDLCEGLIQYSRPRPMTPLSKPRLLEAATDPEFGTTILRITAVSAGGPNPAITPLYSTVAAWNADESYLLLYRVGGGHELYDGRTYAFIRRLDIRPADIEQVYWHTEDPDVFFYVDGKTLIRYHVESGVKENRRTFEFCFDKVTAGNDPMFTSWDSAAIGLLCGDRAFIYRIDTDEVSGLVRGRAEPPQMAPSGELAFDNGDVVDRTFGFQRKLDLGNTREHASLGRLADGRDTYNAVQFEKGPRGSDVGSLVTHDMTDGTWRVIVGPGTGFPYPPAGTHVSALAYRRPGWVFLSIVGNPSGEGVLDNEILAADTNTGRVCRAAHHRSSGRNNASLATPYWAEPHVVPSPSGTRAVFASDWGGGPTVDTYVIELPGYARGLGESR